MAYSTTEILEKTKINSESTVRKYEKEFGLKIARKSSGEKIYSDNDLEVLINIKNLRESDNGIETIKRILSTDEPHKGRINEVNNINDESTIDVDYEPVYEPDAIEKIETGLINLDKKFDLIAKMADNYSNTKYQLGLLTGELRSAYDKIDELKSERKTITEGTDATVCELKNNLKDKDLKIAELEKELRDKESSDKNKIKSEFENYRNRTFFQRLLGR